MLTTVSCNSRVSIDVNEELDVYNCGLGEDYMYDEECWYEEYFEDFYEDYMYELCMGIPNDTILDYI